MLNCVQCNKSFDAQYALDNHVAQTHTTVKSADGHNLHNGLAVWDYDLKLGTVNLNNAHFDGTSHDPERVWFDVEHPKMPGDLSSHPHSSLMNGERVVLRHPTTRQLADEALNELKAKMDTRPNQRDEPYACPDCGEMVSERIVEIDMDHFCGCIAEIFSGSREEQASFCEAPVVPGTKYCENHVEPVEDEFEEPADEDEVSEVPKSTKQTFTKVGAENALKGLFS